MPATRSADPSSLGIIACRTPNWQSTRCHTQDLMISDMILVLEATTTKQCVLLDKWVGCRKPMSCENLLLDVSQSGFLLA